MMLAIPNIFRALASPNYRLYFVGHGLSQIGTWITKTVAIWLIYELTDSPLMVGIIAFFSLSPTIIFAPVGGLIADRKDRRKILILVQTVATVRALILAMLAFSNHLSIGALVLLTAIQALIEAIDDPTRQALIPTLLVNKEYLTNAIALNSILVSLSRLLGPAIAGILLAYVGAGFCFLADGLSYLAILSALLAMRDLQTNASPLQLRQPWRDIQSGVHYALQSLPIRTVLLQLAVVNLFATPIITLGPVFAERILQGGPEIFGLFVTASGVGGIFGAIMLSLWSSVRGLDALLTFSPLLTGVALMGFAQSRWLNLSLLLIMGVGFLLILQISASNTILQTVTEETKRGRIMSLFVITNGTMLPFGNLLAGVIADWFTAPFALMLEGGLCMASVLFFLPNFPRLRQAIAQASRPH